MPLFKLLHTEHLVFGEADVRLADREGLRPASPAALSGSAFELRGA
jgi:hypothetical protein